MLIATRFVIGHAVKSTPSKVEGVGEAAVMRTLAEKKTWLVLEQTKDNERCNDQ